VAGLGPLVVRELRPGEQRAARLGHRLDMPRIDGGRVVGDWNIRWYSKEHWCRSNVAGAGSDLAHADSRAQFVSRSMDRACLRSFSNRDDVEDRDRLIRLRSVNRAD